MRASGILPTFRFRLGDASFTVLSDGEVVSGRPSVTHPRPAVEVDALLTQSFLPIDRIVFAANVLLMEHAGAKVLFDAGLGDMKTKPAWGAGAGRLTANLAAASVSPASIDAVALTHGHSEHVSGLITEEGAPAFARAKIFVHAEEFRFWSDAAAARTSSFDHAQFVRALAPYDVHALEDREEILPGVRAVATPGHTVGHTSFMIASGGRRLCVLGDLARHHILNIERPDWPFVGDADHTALVASRRRMLGFVADERIPVLSYHFPWPGLGHVARSGDAFRYYPLPLSPGVEPAL